MITNDFPPSFRWLYFCFTARVSNTIAIMDGLMRRPDKRFLGTTWGPLHHLQKLTGMLGKMVQKLITRSLVDTCHLRVQGGSGGGTAKWATKRYSITWLTRNTMTLENCHLHQVSSLFYFTENMDNFEARTERVNFGLFQSNSDFTWPNLTLQSTVITQQIWAWNSNIDLLFRGFEKYVRICDKIL